MGGQPLLDLGDGLVDGIGNLLRVPWVHHNRAVQALRGPGEFGKDHDTLAGLLAGDVLVGNLCNRVGVTLVVGCG